MKVYVAGPMRGIKDFNFPAFFAAAERLKALGHEVFNPAAKDIEMYGAEVGKSETGDLQEASNKGFSLRAALALDLAWICEHADAVALLPGWPNSKGACAEKATAEALGLKVLYIYDWGIIDEYDVTYDVPVAPAIPNFDTVR